MTTADQDPPLVGVDRHPVAVELLLARDHRLVRRPGPVGDDEVHRDAGREHQAEHHEQQGLGADDAGEHRREADRAEPQQVGVEAGEDAEQDQQHAEDDQRRQQRPVASAPDGRGRSSGRPGRPRHVEAHSWSVRQAAARSRRGHLCAGRRPTNLPTSRGQFPQPRRRAGGSGAVTASANHAPRADSTLDIEGHAAAAGWDQPPRLFALVETADLLRREPQLAAELGLVERRARRPDARRPGRAARPLPRSTSCSPASPGRRRCSARRSRSSG